MTPERRKEIEAKYINKDQFDFVHFMPKSVISELLREIERLNGFIAKWKKEEQEWKEEEKRLTEENKAQAKVIEELKSFPIIKEINDWQDKTFPDANPTSIFFHMVEEFSELQKDKTDASEMADIFILLVGLAHNSGVDLIQAVKGKFDINKKRTWGEPDENGVINHIANKKTE